MEQAKEKCVLTENKAQYPFKRKKKRKICHRHPVGSWPTNSQHSSVKCKCEQLSGGKVKGCTHGPNIPQQSIETSQHLTRVNGGQFRQKGQDKKKSGDQFSQPMAIPIRTNKLGGRLIYKHWIASTAAPPKLFIFIYFHQVERKKQNSVYHAQRVAQL